MGFLFKGQDLTWCPSTLHLKQIILAEFLTCDWPFFLFNMDLLLLELNPSPPLSLGDFCPHKTLSSVDFPSRPFPKSFFKEVTWALSSLISSTWLVTIQVLEEVEASLLEQQGKESNSSHDVATMF